MKFNILYDNITYKNISTNNIFRFCRVRIIIFRINKTNVVIKTYILYLLTKNNLSNKKKIRIYE